MRACSWPQLRKVATADACLGLLSPHMTAKNSTSSLQQSLSSRTNLTQGEEEVFAGGRSRANRATQCVSLPAWGGKPFQTNMQLQQ
jgi:hypothetical protein